MLLKDPDLSNASKHRSQWSTRPSAAGSDTGVLSADAGAFKRRKNLCILRSTQVTSRC